MWRDRRILLGVGRRHGDARGRAGSEVDIAHGDHVDGHEVRPSVLLAASLLIRPASS
jgi:hypothetical protein